MPSKQKTKKVVVPKGYEPSDDDEFMNPVMREFFRQKLLDWKADIDAQTLETMENLKGEAVSHPDPSDTATANANRQLELRTRDRLRKLSNKIEKTLRRVDSGEYGYCEETGDPIRVKRLMARPIATLSIEAQEMHEKGERTRAN
jgi:DnaK suppressor protein